MPMPWPPNRVVSRCSWPHRGPSAEAARVGVAWVAPLTPRRAWRSRSAWAASTWPICTSPWHPARHSPPCATPPACVPSRSTARRRWQAWRSCGRWWTAPWARPICASPGRTPPATCWRACCPAPTTSCRRAWSPACSGRRPMPPASSWSPASGSAPACDSPCAPWPRSTRTPSGASRSSARPTPHGARATPYPRCCATWWTWCQTPGPWRAPMHCAGAASPCCPRWTTPRALRFARPWPRAWPSWHPAAPRPMTRSAPTRAWWCRPSTPIQSPMRCARWRRHRPRPPPWVRVPGRAPARDRGTTWPPIWRRSTAAWPPARITR